MRRLPSLEAQISEVRAGPESVNANSNSNSTIGA